MRETSCLWLSGERRKISPTDKMPSNCRLKKGLLSAASQAISMSGKLCPNAVTIFDEASMAETDSL